MKLEKRGSGWGLCLQRASFEACPTLIRMEAKRIEKAWL